MLSSCLKTLHGVYAYSLQLVSKVKISPFVHKKDEAKGAYPHLNAIGFQTKISNTFHSAFGGRLFCKLPSSSSYFLE